MEDFVNIASFIIFLIILIILVRLIFRKGEIHFLLLEIMFPEKLMEVGSYYDLMFGFSLFKFSFPLIVWITTPIYISQMYDKKESNEEAFKLHKKLIRNNKMIFISFIVMVIWLFGTGYIISKLYPIVPIAQIIS